MHKSDPHPNACVNMQILRASHAILQRFDRAYRPFGIRATQLPVLALVARLGPVELKRLVLETAGERSALSRKLKVMVAQGWVAEERQGREKRYRITPEGRALLRQVEPVRDQVQAELMAALGAEEAARFLASCQRLVTQNQA